MSTSSKLTASSQRRCQDQDVVRHLKFVQGSTLAFVLARDKFVLVFEWQNSCCHPRYSYSTAYRQYLLLCYLPYHKIYELCKLLQTLELWKSEILETPSTSSLATQLACVHLYYIQRIPRQMTLWLLQWNNGQSKEPLLLDQDLTCEFSGLMTDDESRLQAITIL